MKLIGILFFALVAGAYGLKAEFVPGFNMEICVGEATSIVRGNLNANGELIVSEVLTGQLPDVYILKLDLGRYHFEQFQKEAGRGEPLDVSAFFEEPLQSIIRQGEQIEVVAFLKEYSAMGWRLVLHYAGIVGFGQDKVFFYRGSYHDSDEPAYTRASFLQTLFNSIQTAKELNVLLIKPPSVERARELASFALAHEQVTGEQRGVSWYGGSYRLGLLAAALKEQGSDGQKEVLQALSLAKTSQDQVTLVTLVGGGSGGRSSFGSSVKFPAQN